MEDCEASTDVLQSQVDEAKERSQRELAELRRQLQEKGAELEKSRLAAKKLQDEVWPSQIIWLTHQNEGSHVKVTDKIDQREFCSGSERLRNTPNRQKSSQVQYHFYHVPLLS